MWVFTPEPVSRHTPYVGRHHCRDLLHVCHGIYCYGCTSSEDYLARRHLKRESELLEEVLLGLELNV